MDRVFVLAFKNAADIILHKKCNVPTAKITSFNVIINGINFFNELLNNDEISYDQIGDIPNGQGDGYAINCLLDYAYCKEHYGMIIIDLNNKYQILIQGNTNN